MPSEWDQYKVAAPAQDEWSQFKAKPSAAIDYSKPTEPSNLQKLGTGVKDFTAGIGAGAISTGVGAYNLARKIPGADSVLTKPNEYVEGLTRPPDSDAGHAGKMTEQVGEFMIPGGAISKGAKAIEGATAGMRAAPVVNTLGRAALEGASAAGVTGVQTGGDAEQVKKAALIGGGLGAAGAAVKEFAPPLLEASAEKGMNQALGATRETMKVASAKAVPKLIQRRVWAFTRKGLLNKVAGEAGDAGTELENAYNALPPNAKLKISPILDDIEKAKQEFVVKGTGEIGNPEAHQHLTEMQAKLVQSLQPDLVGDVSVESARSLRQILDKQVARAGGYFGKSLNDASTISAKEAGANAIRRVLNSEYPDIAKLNSEFSFWSNVQTVLGETIKRSAPQATPLSQQMGRVAGAVAAGHGIPALGGAIVGDAVVKAISSPGWRMVSAVNKARLADMLSSGAVDQAGAFALRLVAGANVDRPAFTVNRDRPIPKFAAGGIVAPNKKRHRYGPPKGMPRMPVPQAPPRMPQI